MKTTKRILVLLFLMVVTMGAWADPYWRIKEKNDADWQAMVVQTPVTGFNGQATYTTASLAAGNYTFYIEYFADNSVEISSANATANIDGKGAIDGKTGLGDGLSFSLTNPATVVFVCKHAGVNKWTSVVCNAKNYYVADTGWEVLAACKPSPNSTTSVTYFNARANNVGTSKFIDASALAATTTTHTALPNNGSDFGGFAKSGSTVKGVNKVTLDYEAATMVYESVTTLPVTITSAGASTLVLPAQATIPGGVKAYKLKYENSVLKATELTFTIPANTPVLLNANPGTYDFVMGENAVEYNTASETISSKSKSYIKDVNRDENFIDADNVLVGAMQPHYVPTGSYVLQNGNNGLGFYNVGETANYRINQFRCYITLPEPAARSLSIVFDDSETTGIADVRGQKEDVRSDIFNLSGQRVGKDYKGVVIKNGRKMIQK